MRIEFGLSVQDFRKIQKHQRAMMNKVFSFHSSIWSKLLWALGAVFWVVPIMLFVANLPSGMGFWLLYVVLFPIVIFTLLTFLQKRKFYRLAEPGFPPGLTRSVTIADNGLTSAAGLSNSFRPWSDVREIVETLEYTIFVLPLFECIAVPTRFFSDKDQLAAFVNETRNKMARETDADGQRG